VLRTSTSLEALPRRKAEFIEPMECLAVPRLADGADWVWEIKLDGYRTLTVKDVQGVTLFSRRKQTLNKKFPYIVDALSGLPEGTVLDGELVAIDDTGRPSFNLLQNFRASASRIQYYVFDLLICKNRDLTRLPLIERRRMLKAQIKFSDNRIRVSEFVETTSAKLLAAIRAQGLEGIVGKRKSSLYESGKRTGSWVKHRVNRGQELVIGGYRPGGNGIDAILVGYYSDKGLIYVAKVRNGFVPASRREVFQKLRRLVVAKCPFVNLPEKRPSRWGEGLTAEGMKECVWVRPEIVAQIEFLEWTENDHLRHSKFVGLRDDKDPRQVVKEEANESRTE
jgi:bifunctional non-homologous end joining protein LigD